jgi:hypothetical protein
MRWEILKFLSMHFLRYAILTVVVNESIISIKATAYSGIKNDWIRCEGFD